MSCTSASECMWLCLSLVPWSGWAQQPGDEWATLSPVVIGINAWSFQAKKLEKFGLLCSIALLPSYPKQKDEQSW